MKRGKNKMIKPKYVHNGKTYTREDAVKAMGISQASFSKYFAFENVEELIEHTTPNRVVYKGIELNKRIAKLRGDSKPESSETAEQLTIDTSDDSDITVKMIPVGLKHSIRGEDPFDGIPTTNMYNTYFKMTKAEYRKSKLKSYLDQYGKPGVQDLVSNPNMFAKRPFGYSISAIKTYESKKDMIIAYGVPSIVVYVFETGTPINRSLLTDVLTGMNINEKLRYLDSCIITLTHFCELIDFLSTQCKKLNNLMGITDDDTYEYIQHVLGFKLEKDPHDDLEYLESLRDELQGAKYNKYYVWLNDDLQSDKQIFRLIKPGQDNEHRYLADTLKQHVVIKSDKREGLLFKYLQPLMHVWANQTYQPNIISICDWKMVRENDKLFDKYQYNKNVYDSTIDGPYDTLPMFKYWKDASLNKQMENAITHSNKPFMLQLYLLTENADDVQMQHNITQMLDNVLTYLLSNERKTLKSANRRTKVIIDDVNTNILACDKMQKLLERYIAIGLGAGIDLIIATNKQLPDYILRNVTVVDNLADFPIVIDTNNGQQIIEGLNNIK